MDFNKGDKIRRDRGEDAHSMFDRILLGVVTGWEEGILNGELLRVFIVHHKDKDKEGSIFKLILNDDIEKVETNICPVCGNLTKECVKNLERNDLVDL